MLDEQATIAELRELASQTSHLESDRKGGELHTRWALRVLTLLEDVFGKQSRFFKTFAGLTFRTHKQIVASYDEIDYLLGSANREAYISQLETARGILVASADEVQRKGMINIRRADPESPAARVLDLVQNGTFRALVQTKPENEREVQDVFEGMLRATGLAYHREKERIPFSTRSYIPDFTFDAESLAVELKFAKHDGQDREFVAEINDDVCAYSTKWSTLIFVVYDIAGIRDVPRFSTDLERENVRVLVVKH